LLCVVKKEKKKTKNELGFICPAIRWDDFRHDWIHQITKVLPTTQGGIQVCPAQFYRGTRVSCPCYRHFCINVL
jgi:hypothetical protein